MTYSVRVIHRLILGISPCSPLPIAYATYDCAWDTAQYCEEHAAEEEGDDNNDDDGDEEEEVKKAVEYWIGLETKTSEGRWQRKRERLRSAVIAKEEEGKEDVLEIDPNDKRWKKWLEEVTEDDDKCSLKEEIAKACAVAGERPDRA